MQQISSAVPGLKQVVSQQLKSELSIHSEKCIECKLCRKECKFLKKYGSPKHIADTYDPASPEHQMMPFECSLCKLCAAVCPVNINPADMFLEMRRESVVLGAQHFSDYGSILNYESKGTSKLYSYYSLPEQCDTVLFPGCTLPGTRPDKVKSLFNHLQETIPDLGLVLDCCTKPSHDLGRHTHFQAMFNEMKEYLLQKGVRNVLVACPNCYRVFNEFGDTLKVKTVYEYLAETSLPATPNIPEVVTVHDPCGTRHEEQIHKAVRQLATGKSLTIEEMTHNGPKTICCGEGGSVGCVNPDYSKSWGARRKEEANGTRILTYCAGCANFLQSVNPTSHILDLLFEPEATLAGKVKVSKAPFTYLNRLRLKRHFRKNLNAAVSRERTVTGENGSRGGMLKKILVLATLIGVIVAVRMSGVAHYLEQEKLRVLIESYGAMASVIYMLTYAVAPSLFLPGLPITIVGGILFGPFWGVVYSITGATAGACIAFLVSRYLGREWIERKLRSPKWRKLDTMVEEHGWKAVAFTRLIPLFPFNLLNYAFGLTKVKFIHYAVTSFICMLPACVAFIVFSSSLLEVIQGNFTSEFVVGIVLIIAVSMIPFFYKQFKAKKQTTKSNPTKSLESTLKIKGITLLALLGFALIASLIVYKYFYYLDAFFYTYEFYWMFNVNNLQAANTAMFTDYFRPMGITTEALPQLILSNLIQNFYLPFSKPILVSASTSAYGLGLGAFFSSVSFVAVGLLSFGLGAFFLGDILPFFKRKELSKYQASIARPTAIAFPLLFALPFLPISFVAIGCAALKVSWQRLIQFMSAGLLIRLIWLLTLPVPFS